MNILFTMTPAFNPNDGGVQRTTYKLGKYFTEQGLEVSYFSTAHTGHVEADYGTLYHAKEKGDQNNPKNIAWLAKVLRDQNPDFVINQMPYETSLSEELAGLKTKLNFILLGCLRNSLFNFKSNARDEMQKQLPNAIFKAMDNRIGLGVVQQRHRIKHRGQLKQILDRHDKFILLAPSNRTELDYFVGDYKADKVLSIPNSIPEVYGGSLPSEKTILHVGRLNIPQKRSDLLLDFWEKCYKAIPDWTFVIVGEGPYRKTLEEDIKKRQLPRVSLEGFQKPEPYYKKAPIFMMPSAFEGFPNTLLEAQSFGCVPLAFNSYLALEWIVNDKKDAFLVPAFDTQKMAQQTITLIAENGKLAKMQEAAKENAGRFTIEKVGERWMELFKNMGGDAK